jgi:hypothetical protein
VSGQIIGSSKKRKVGVCFEPSISPVIVANFIIELLLEFRMLLKVFIGCHCADLFLSTENRCLKGDGNMFKTLMGMQSSLKIDVKEWRK